MAVADASHVVVGVGSGNDGHDVFILATRHHWTYRGDPVDYRKEPARQIRSGAANPSRALRARRDQQGRIRSSEERSAIGIGRLARPPEPFISPNGGMKYCEPLNRFGEDLSWIVSSPDHTIRPGDHARRHRHANPAKCVISGFGSLRSLSEQRVYQCASGFSCPFARSDGQCYGSAVATDEKTRRQTDHSICRADFCRRIQDKWKG